ncbi:MAG: acylphosphatase [Salibacteraceae bacterium]
MKKHLNIQIFGLVQGVWFRKNTKQKADALAISGFVRNEKDGSVYLELEGDASMIDIMLEWCERGPELARVDKLKKSEGAFMGLNGFEIHH